MPLHTHANNLSGSLSGATATGASAGTPAGTISSVATTVSLNSTTDSSDGTGGSNKFIVSGSTITNGAPTFTGSAMSNHTHTVTGSVSVSGTIGRVTGATRPVDSPAFLVLNYIAKL